MIKFSNDLYKRLEELKTLVPEERKCVLDFICEDVPISPWPFGMPCSTAPHVVVLGVSPGNRPRPEDKDFQTDNATTEPPTFGEVHGGFCYEDPGHYWEKVRELCSFLVRRDAKKLSMNEALSLSGHLNLGTGQYGEAGENAIDPKIVSWVSTLLFKRFAPKILVCFGLKSLLSKDSINQFWNVENGLKLDWNQPGDTKSFLRYSFRFWKAERLDGSQMAVLMWPNHPSRHPFAGNAQKKPWQQSLQDAGELLEKHGF